MGLFVLGALLIGFVAGLRSMMAPAAIAWAANFRAIDLSGTALHFVTTPFFLALFSILAVGELVADKLPFIPSRITMGPLMFRLVSGAFCGACLTAHHSLGAGTTAGAVGAMAGAFAGYYTRRRLVTQFGLRDPVVAVTEDILAIGLAVLSLNLR